MGRITIGKRSNFERRERDYYPTPKEAVIPLIPHLPEEFVFAEPCAGDGQLVRILEDITGEGMCSWESDIEPQANNIVKMDALEILEFHSATDYIITNPPWDRKILHPMIEHFRNILPTWLLFDADWAYTKQASPYLKFCRKIVSIGRVKWIPESKMTGKDNCAWYLFDKEPQETIFYGR